jgi:hypothetical protein
MVGVAATAVAVAMEAVAMVTAVAVVAVVMGMAAAGAADWAGAAWGMEAVGEVGEEAGVMVVAVDWAVEGWAWVVAVEGWAQVAEVAKARAPLASTAVVEAMAVNTAEVGSVEE